MYHLKLTVWICLTASVLSFAFKSHHTHSKPILYSKNGVLNSHMKRNHKTFFGTINPTSSDRSKLQDYTSSFVSSSRLSAKFSGNEEVSQQSSSAPITLLAAANSVSGSSLYGRMPYDDWMFTNWRLTDPNLLRRTYAEAVSRTLRDSHCQ